MMLILGDNAMAADQVRDQRTTYRLSRPISLDDAGDPIHVKVSMVKTFSFAVMGD